MTRQDPEGPTERLPLRVQVPTKAGVPPSARCGDIRRAGLSPPGPQAGPSWKPAWPAPRRPHTMGKIYGAGGSGSDPSLKGLHV